MITRLFLAVLCVCGWQAGGQSATNEPQFQLFNSVINIPERGPVPSFAIQTGTARFNFIPPPGCAAELDRKARKLKLTPTDRKYLISFRVTDQDPALVTEPGQPSLHANL